MNRISISGNDHFLFQAVWHLYTSAFPYAEQREPEDLPRVFAHPDYHLEAWVEDGQLLGFIEWWHCGGLRFIEHYAISPDVRSSGYGSRFLREWIAGDNLPVLLEIEPAADEITCRRQAFYHRLGFKDNPAVDYWLPSYHKGMGPINLWIMTYPDFVQQSDYYLFCKKLIKEIMPSW